MDAERVAVLATVGGIGTLANSDAMYIRTVKNKYWKGAERRKKRRGKKRYSARDAARTASSISRSIS